VPDRKLINPPELFAPPGFSHVAVGDGRRLVCIAGQVALAPDFTIIGSGDLGAQTRAAMQSVPAQTIIGVTGLALPGLLIEVEVTALIG
jgi:enamine deaminase RidA (YjgF/YER057c/UK114 family)